MITTRVAGVTFAPGYPLNLGDLARRCVIEGPVALELVREHDNAHDLNAIAVHLENRMLGHVPAELAEPIARELDLGVPWSAEALFVAVDVEHRGRPGLEIQLHRGPKEH